MTDEIIQRIGVNKVVTLHFAVCLANGQLLDTTREREQPVSFTSPYSRLKPPPLGGQIYL